MVFRGLPTSAATWNSSGNFTAVLESESVGPQHKQDDLQPWEHGYTATKTTTGTEISSGSKFEELFSRTGSIETTDTSTYYLTKDIVITGFTGKQFAGTLDGNGHTIYIAASDTSLAGHTLTGYNGNAVGGVIGALSGTIKNVRVVIDANITVGLNANLRGRVGGVVGRLLNGGSIENVQVIIPGDVTLSYTNAGDNDVSMGAVVGQATGASTISGLTVQMDGTLAPVGSYVWVSAVVGEIQAKSDHADTVSMNNIIVRGAGTFAAEATSGTNSGEPPYVSALATFNNNGENYPLVNLDGLIYDFDPTFSADGSAMYGLFVNNDSDGNTANYDNYVADSNLFIMQGREYTPTKDGTEAGNTYIPLDSTFRTINSSVDGLTSSSVAAYFMPGTGLVRLQVHSDSWGDERLTISGVTTEQGTPIMSSLTTAGDSSSDRYFSVAKSTLSGLGAAVQVSLFSNVTDPTVQSLTYTGSPLDIVIDMNYNGAPLTAGDYSLSGLTASGGNALVQDGKPLNAGEYSVTVTLNNPEHWFAVHGSGEASKTANVTFTVSPKNVTMQAPGDSMTADYGEKYWIKSDNNVWGLNADLFFAEEVGNVEYTATVTRKDGGSGYASTSGWLKAGSYRVALTINDSNYAINGNASVIYPLTITPVGLSYTLTVENSVAAVYDGNVRTISGTPQGGDGIISAAYEGSAGTAGDSVTAAVSVTYGGVAAHIQNAGDYVLGVALSGDDAENYTAVLTASWTDGGAIANNTVTVEKYPFTLQWGFDSQVALEYGDDITDDLIAETELFEAAAIPYNGGSFTGKISFNVVSATYDGGTPYAPGVAVGTSVTFEVKPVLPDVLDENNYNINVTASGSVTKMVAQRTLTVNYDAFDMTAVYGDSISNEWLTEQYKEEIAANVSNIYNNEEVNFKVILYYRTFGGAYQEISDFSALEMGVTYMAAVVVDGNNNYTIPNSLSNGYDFNLTARTLTISGITWAEDGFDGVYDGQAHALKAVLAEGSSLKEGDEGVLELSVESITNVSDSGSVTVSVARKYADEYNLTGTTEFTVTLNKKTLTILPYNAANFLDHDEASLYAHLTNAESGLINGAIEGETLTFGGTWATVPTTVKIGEKSYVAAGSYTLNMNPPSGNYQFENNAMSVTVNELDIGSAEVTWKESDLTYDAAKQSVSLASVTVKGVDLPVEWFNLTDNAGTDADTYTATVAASNANITGSVSKEFTIAPVAVTVKWEAAGEISVGTAMPENATDMSALDLTARVTEFNAPGITDAAQYSIVVTASGFDAGHSFAAGDKVTLTPSMTFAEGVKASNYLVTFDPENIVKTATAISVVIKPANATPAAVIYGNSVKNANEFISSEYFFIESGAEGSALTPDNFTVTVTDENDKAVFGTHGLDAGTYTVTIEGKGAYSVSNDDNSFTYTVDPLTLTEGTWSGLDDLEYSGNAAVPGFTLKGVLNGDNVSVGYTIDGDKATNGQAINAGSYTVTAHLEGDDAGNYEFDGKVNVKTFTIARKTVSVAWGTTAFTYNGTAQAPTATATGWQNGENHDSTLNGLITIGGNDTQALNAGDYTATITKEALETALDNYTLAQDASVEFTVAPATLNLTIKMKESGSGASVANQFTWNVSGKITVTKTADGWTLACGDVSYNVTVTGGEDVENLLDMLQLTLNGSEYNGTPYGTRVQNGELGVASTNPNYTVELVAPVIINIVPDISIEINTGAEYPDSAVYSKDKTYTAEDFAGYFSIDGQPDGTWDYSVEEEESGSFSDVGTYTIKATFTITASRIQLETHFTFTITQATVTGVKLNGDGVYTYGELKAGDTVSVTVTYSDGNTATVNVGFEAAESTGGYVKAGEQTIKVSYTNDDSDYAAVTEHEITVTVKKKTITATINYGEQSGTELTLTYNGSVGYTIGAELNDVLSGDGVSAKVLQSSFIDVAAYEVEITLDGNDKDNYMVEGEYTVTITPADVTYEWNFADGAKITYGDSVEAVTALAVMPDGALLGVEGKVAFQVSVGDYSATTNAGTEVTFTVTAKLPEGAKEKNYNIIITAADGNTLNVGKATLTLDIADTASLTKVYDGDAVTLESLLTADNVSVKGMKNGEDAFTLDILAISGTDEMTNAGTYNGSVSVIENCNYTAEAIKITYIITPKPIDVAWSNTEFTYNGTAHKPTATATGLEEGDSLTLTVTGEQTNANAEGETYTATVKAFIDGNYKLESDSTRTFTIARRGLDVAEVAEAVYGNLQVSGTLVTGTHTAFVAYNDEEIELIVNVKTAALSRAAAEYLDAGEYEVTIALANENGNFSLNGATLNAETQKMEVESTLDVAPKTVEVGYTTSSPVYDAKGISVTIDKFEDMLIEGDDPAVNIYINDAPYTGRVVLDAGEYTVRYESADPNYAFAPVSATFTIAPKSVTPNFDLNTGSGSQQITGGGKLEIEEGEETDIVAAIDSFMQSSGVPEEDMSISVSGDLKLEDMATWAPGTYTVTVTLSGNHSGSMQFTVEVSEKIELPPPVEPELPETPVEAGSGNDWVLPLVIAIVALIDLTLLVAIGVAAKKRA